MKPNLKHTYAKISIFSFSKRITHDYHFAGQSTDDEDGLWDVKKILDEDVAHGEYFVEWEGTDPTTGEPWAPTWVKKTDCTDLLIRDWKEEQARQQKAKQRPAQKTTMRT
jgi:hypothetical protein